LDIDGVINSTRTQLAFGGYPHDFSERDMARFDPVALALIRKLCDITGAVVVLTTTWRLTFTLHEVEKALDLPVIGATPDLGGDFCRADEVTMWLATAKGVTHYAIVDDLALDFEDPRHALRFVQTNPDNGLSLANYRHLWRLLENGPPP
jgi:hypothetical protein